MVDITYPAYPLDPLAPYIGLDLSGQQRATYTSQANGGRSLVFKYTVKPGDWTADLAYTGTDAFRLGNSGLRDADDDTDLSGITLPPPGQPNSLSHGKQIALGPDDAFVTTWRTTADDESITIPVGGTPGTYTVYWGDGTSSSHAGDATHVYGAAGNHTISISGGLTRIHLNAHADAPKLVSIDNWGNASWTTMEGAFRGATNMAYRAADTPNLSGVTDMSQMFRDAFSFNGGISGWNVSQVANMSGMFRDAASFRQPIGDWNVSRVADMSSMFRAATSFNQPIGDWNVSRVTDMSSMFRAATSFNQPIGDWNVSRVTDMTYMFRGALLFKQNLGNWYVALNSTTADAADVPGIVGAISAQNAFLDGQSPVFGIGSGGDSSMFSIADDDMLNMTSVSPYKAVYTVNVTASGESVFEDGNNWRIVTVTLEGELPQDPAAFTTTWRTTTANDTITLPVSGSGMFIPLGGRLHHHRRHRPRRPHLPDGRQL